MTDSDKSNKSYDRFTKAELIEMLDARDTEIGELTGAFDDARANLAAAEQAIVRLQKIPEQAEKELLGNVPITASGLFILTDVKVLNETWKGAQAGNASAWAFDVMGATEAHRKYIADRACESRWPRTTLADGTERVRVDNREQALILQDSALRVDNTIRGKDPSIPPMVLEIKPMEASEVMVKDAARANRGAAFLGRGHNCVGVRVDARALPVWLKRDEEGRPLEIVVPLQPAE
jgi:hypothetical protein